MTCPTSRILSLSALLCLCTIGMRPTRSSAGLLRNKMRAAAARFPINMVPRFDSAPCRAANGSTPAHQLDEHALEALAGTYLMRVVASDSASPDTVAVSLVLLQTDSSHRRFKVLPGQHRFTTYILYGYTDANFRGFGNLVVPAASRDADAPGVQVTSDGLMAIGNPMTTTGMAFDAGIFLRIQHLDSLSFSGRWTTGSHVVPSRHGYFCARRAR